MQGGVWGPLQCSVQIDEIGKECLQTGKYIYKYKGSVNVPPLAMIDDVAAIGKCGINSVMLNSFINTKIKADKLTFGENKCHKLHIENGKFDSECLDLMVQNSEMSTVKTIKYLGEQENNNGKNDINIEERCKKGLGINSQTLGLVKEISLGNHFFEIGLLLRDSNLINGIMYNSEAWYGVLQRHIEKMEKVDEAYLRSLLDAHSKTPIESLYIETGKMPLRFILQKRRLIYWHHLVNLKNDSLLKKFYEAQLNQPVKGDWVTLLKKDKDDFQIKFTDEELKGISKSKFKKIIKKKANKIAIEYLKKLKANIVKWKT